MFMRRKPASVENYFEDVWTIYVFDLLLKHRKLLMFASFKQTPSDMIPAVCVRGPLPSKSEAPKTPWGRKDG